MNGTETQASLIETQEHCRCTACQSAIPRENVAMNIDTRSGLQVVRAYCEHCGILLRVRRRLAGDTWRMVGAVERVTDAKELSQFRARIAHLRGDVALAS